MHTFYKKAKEIIMDNSQGNIGYFPSMPVCDKHFSTELAADYSLPDYHCEIRRILSSNATVIPSRDFFGNGEAELSGEVFYKILYLGTDGKPYSITLSDKYSVKLPLEFDSHSVNIDEVSLISSCACDTMSARVLGPRKLSVKANLDCRLLALSPSLYTPKGIGEGNFSTVETLVREVPSIKMQQLDSEELQLNDFIPMDSDVDSVRIISSTPRVYVSECSHTAEGVAIRGEVILSILYCNDAESDLALTMARKLPFSTLIKCKDAIAGGEACANGEVFDEQISVDEGGIKIELCLSLHATIQGNEQVSYVTDAFSTECESEAEGLEVGVIAAHRCANKSLTQNDVFALDEAKIPRDAVVINAFARATLSEMKCKGTNLSFGGNVHYTVLYFNDGEYLTRELSSPLHYNLECKSASDCAPMRWSAHATVTSSRVRSDGEKLFVDSELCFAFCVQEYSSITVVNELNFGKALPKRRGGMTLCYPERCESLWSVAKRYGVPTDRICKRNSIENTTGAVKKKYLVI